MKLISMLRLWFIESIDQGLEIPLGISRRNMLYLYLSVFLSCQLNLGHNTIASWHTRLHVAQMGSFRRQSRRTIDLIGFPQAKVSLRDHIAISIE